MSAEVTVTIMFMSGPDDGKEITITHPVETGDVLCRITIGRREEYDIVIPFDTLVSRLHASILIRQEDIVLIDEGSRNGTFINRKVVQKSPESLHIGELFRVGKTWLRIQSVEKGTY